MANIKLNIGDPKSKRTFQIELDEQGSAKLQGKKIGETFKGELVDRPGYEFHITGGSDTSGFPMRNDVEGQGRRKVLITRGIGNRATRKGMRLRCTVTGNTVGASMVQVNVKVTKHGPKPLKEEAKKEEKAE
jgi:small subunit ribosomal protein S6e